MKTAELTGCELDQWVAKALGYEARALLPDELVGRHPAGSGFKVWSPSADWAQGGPIIERERIQLMPWKVELQHIASWTALTRGKVAADGSTPLIAAMRAFVASKFGEEVPDA